MTLNWLWLRLKIVQELSEEVTALHQTLVKCAGGEDGLRRENERLSHQLEIEKTKRVASDSVAAERLEEIGRLREDMSAMREQYQAAISERIRSVDAVNVKLMTTSAPEPPHIDEYRAKMEDAKVEVVKDTLAKMKQRDRAMDMALLTTLHPNFKKSAKG